MTRRLLLVDDEELFLKSLKDGLGDLSDVFETDICYSVNEAIKHMVSKTYDLIITDIRMPGKSGLDLLIYLRDARFQGKVMVMSAYSTAESANKIKSLGVVGVISKPFKVEWFKDMLLDYFTREENRTITFESIDLVTVMQIINLEKKTSALQIDTQDKRGMIYFEDGEIIHAEYNGIQGKEAILKLVSLNTGMISVKNIKDMVTRTMEIPFVEQMMDIMKTIDEFRRGQQKKLGKNSKKNKEKEVNMAVSEILKTLSEVNGYLGAGVFTPQGELLEGSTDVSGIQFEHAGSLIHDTLSHSKNMSKEVGFGSLDMLQLYTNMGVIFAKCYDDGKLHFHTIMVIKTDGNIAMARLKLSKAVDALKAVL